MALVAIVLFACKKDMGKKPPPPGEKYQLITTGLLVDYSSLDRIPCYWIDGEYHALDKDGELQASAYGVEKNGADIFIAGNYSSDGTSIMPCYWKNGKLLRLPVDGLNIDDRCGTRDIHWFNNALYILGDADLQPVIWKIKNGVITIIPVKGNVNQPYGLLSGGNLEIYNNILYFAGNEAFQKDDGTVVYQAGYFTIDALDQQQFHILEDNIGWARSGGIAISEKGIFITGELASSPARLDEMPVLWTSGGRMQPIAQLNRNRQRVGEVVADASGNVYTVIADIQNYQPVFWKLPPGGGYQAIRPEVPAAAKGFCNNLAMRDNKLAYAFSYELQGKYYAFVNIDNKTTPLQMDPRHEVTLQRTRIFPE